jgi:hypothetical protein
MLYAGFSPLWRARRREWRQRVRTFVRKPMPSKIVPFRKCAGIIKMEGGNMSSKAVFGLGVLLLALAPPTARPSGAAEVYDFRICRGYFALCAASTCTSTGGQITVRTATGGTARFPEADCTCPVLLGPSIANLAGGNMQGSCEPPGPGQIWSTYQPRPNIPQALNNWVPTPPEAAAPPLFCPKSLNLGNQLVNCFSFLCDSEHYINGALHQ